MTAKHETRKDEQRIKVSKNGPYLVSGGVPVVEQIICTDTEGTPIEWRVGKKYPQQEKRPMPVA